MSRRAPNPAAERAAQNTATIKNLLKLESNKVCADCKRNKHPRWASWNLGVFVCIRCSGIHRGMGTHISRVKSVDLDSWTDEQMQSILSWGNARANKYWEAKLAAGHAPSEGKIENFIRTKYELKRWTMEGPIPDPSTLDADGDDDVPLSLVKEKQVIERKESIRKASLGKSSAPRTLPPPQGDLIGGDPVQVRSSSAAPPIARVAPKGDPAPPRSTSTKDSLLGLDFFGEPSAPPRPASTTGTNTASGQSPQAPPQQPAQGGFGGIPSPTFAHQSQGSVGGFGDAFAAPDPFANLGSGRVTSNNSAFSGLGGGSFFDSKPAPAAAPAHQKQPSFGGGFGGFSSPAPAAAPAPAKPAQTSSAMGDLFDLSAPVSQTSPPPPSNSMISPTSNSVFNLSTPQPAAPAPVTTATATSSMGGFSGSDVWGGGNEWGAPAAPAPAPVAAQKSPALPMSASNDFGWGSPAAAVPSSSFANTPIVPGASGGFSPQPPKVSADEEFGGWTSSTGPSNSGTTKKSGGGFGGDEDLFSNVWG
ncbi:putative GTPase activating protein for Arf-domain-containing protein [Dactylonectria estremocensis]|uniref:GTPase activating protein for Arf-domain-containing protein n=1 Tax=Dactylonectria estremocensis TaxID=1079267 RepID=A0A9P9F2C6_9HYPO|nr:putative GTPase activating protein for Arf-domain-containing protein [Dactylonectria estremocensis]